jgi:hypothetical protein
MRLFAADLRATGDRTGERIAGVVRDVWTRTLLADLGGASSG